MKKKITKQGYRTLAIVWTLAAAAMGVAFVRYLPLGFNMMLLLLLAMSVLVASNFWKCYKRMPEENSAVNPFDIPPKFADDPELFTDAPPPVGSQLFADDEPGLTAGPNKNSEEKDHE